MAIKHGRRAGAIGGVIVAAFGAALPATAATSIKDYAVPVAAGYETTALFSVDDRVPETSDPSVFYRMVGIPDGLGAHANSDGTTTLFMNHEFEKDVVSSPLVDSNGDPIAGEEYRGAFVSKWILDADGDPISGERAYDNVFIEDTLVGPAAQTGTATAGIARLCSGFLAGSPEGFDRWIYLAGEESDGADTFDGTGGLSFAFYDNEAHALPEQGRFSKENILVQPSMGNRTVIFPMEDGPSTPDSQLWMYVGKKNQSSGAGVLERNGLVNGDLFVFRSQDSSLNSELGFQSGSVTGDWIHIPGAEDMTDSELEAAADAAGAMTFIRPEDGAFNPNDGNQLLFVTTGGTKAQGNELGRLYSLQLHPGNPLKPATLTIQYNADTIIGGGGDIAISPDNVDASNDFLMIQEDGTSPSRTVMGSKGRDGSIWAFPLDGTVDVAGRTRVAELDPPGRDGTAVGPGVWETSGIIDTSDLFGAGTWLFDVQAHSPTTEPGPGTVEDGQLLLLHPAS